MKTIIVAGLYFLGLIYLLIPTPALPRLDNAVLSNEEGDTWQNPDQRGYYTNLNRSQVLSQIQNKSRISFLGFYLPNYRLNYRPEEAGILVRDQLKSNYLEEIVYPFRNSIFVNGWEPKLAPRRNNSDVADLNLAIYGIPYEAKITLKPTSSSPIARILIWTLVFPTAYFVFLSFKKAIYAKN